MQQPEHEQPRAHKLSPIAYLMPKQVSDVVNAVQDHSRPAAAQHNEPITLHPISDCVLNSA